MAFIEQRGSKWRVQVRKGGVQVSATFRTKAEARAWAAVEESAIDAQKRGVIPDKSFADLLRRYIKDVLPAKDGERAERIRLERLIEGRPDKDIKPDPLAAVRLADLGPEHVAAWRDRRLREVSAASVLREWNTLSNACNVARREWRWLRVNPFSEVKRPADAPPRDRRITADEIDRLKLATGYDDHARPDTVMARVGAALLFACETALRAGELCALEWPDVDFDQRTVAVRALTAGARKGGYRVGRVVPLSSEAVRLLQQLQGIDALRVFALDAPSLSVLFAKACKRALIDDLHFHDSRREALTRLAAKVDVMTLAKISGHRDLRILLSTYYQPNMSEVAGRLD